MKRRILTAVLVADTMEAGHSLRVTQEKISRKANHTGMTRTTMPETGN